MRSGQHIHLTISGIHLTVNFAELVTITENFLPFMDNGIKTDYRAEFTEVGILPSTEGELLTDEPDYAVWKTENRITRYYHDRKSEGRIYAVSSLELQQKSLQVKYLPEGKEFFTDTGNCFFHLMWEKILMQEQRMIFHASCIDTEMGGILFSGPSGVGKSTQADLWCRYAQARLLNGDRTILHKRQDGWYGWGSPYAGSSRCYVNDSCRIRAIVMLRQDQCCRLQPLSPAEAFRKIYTGMTVNGWDAEYVESICEMINELIRNVEVYELCCTPDRQAVEILQEKLRERGV